MYLVDSPGTQPLVFFAIKKHIEVFWFQAPDVLLDLTIISTVIRVPPRMRSPFVLA
jgi:hypothetical protein